MRKQGPSMKLPQPQPTGATANKDSTIHTAIEPDLIRTNHCYLLFLYTEIKCELIRHKALVVLNR